MGNGCSAKGISDAEIQNLISPLIKGHKHYCLNRGWIPYISHSQGPLLHISDRDTEVPKRIQNREERQDYYYSLSMHTHTYITDVLCVCVLQIYTVYI